MTPRASAASPLLFEGRLQSSPGWRSQLIKPPELEKVHNLKVLRKSKSPGSGEEVVKIN